MPKMTMEQFVEKYKIGLEVIETVPRNPHMQDSREMVHYKVRLSRPAHFDLPKSRTKTFTLIFSQGRGINHEPTAASVLECLASDAATFVDARSFEEWAPSLGFEPDKLARRTYAAVERQTDKLRDFLGEVLFDFAVFNLNTELETTTLYLVVKVVVEHPENTDPEDVINDSDYSFPVSESHAGCSMETEIEEITTERPTA